MQVERQGSPPQPEASRFDDEVAAAAVPVAAGGSLLMALVGLAHLVIMPPSYRLPLTWLTLGVSAALMLGFGLLRGRKLPHGWGHPVVVLAGALLLVPGVALVAWSQAPRETVNLMLLVLAGGVVLLSYGWWLVLVGLAWFSFAAVVSMAPPHRDWVHFGSAFLGVSVLSLVLVTIRLRTYRRLFSREAALAAALEDMRRSNEALEQFAYVVSHDLQAPIRAVAGYASILREDAAPADDESRVALDGIERSASYMNELVRDLLEYARVGNRGGTFGDVDLDATLDLVLVNLKDEITRQDAEIVRSRLPKVRGDQLQLVQVLQNLVANALKFHGSDAPRVQVGARRQDNGWVISVTDNGIGIDPRFHDRLFKVFERLHSRADYPGTGIGLATCKRVVERHGGRIWIESSEGQGATFSFSLPSESP
jgi:signal transduction histidine kinase